MTWHSLLLRIARLPLWLFLIPLAGTLLALSSSAPLLAQDLTRSEMDAELDQMRDVITRAWANLEDKQANLGVDVEQIFQDANSNLGSIKTREGFLTLLEQCAASLGTGQITIERLSGNNPPGAGLPFKIVEVKEGIGVSHIRRLLTKFFDVR